MDGIKNLFSSEHGIFGILLIVGATVLCILKIMTVEDWKSFAQVIFVAYAGSQAVISGTQSIANRGLPQATASDNKKPEEPKS